ncbi:MAG: hypothetical protein GY874_07680 [Desulfobacteraceae bacterium]|nr:hypothetical protein [Desulfobacteraceae bacterium]
MSSTLQLVTGSLIAIFSSGLFIVIIRRIYAQIDKKADKEVYVELKNKIAEKQQILICHQKHTEIEKEFNRGEKLFSELMKKIEGLQQEQAKTNTFLAKLEAQISTYVKHVLKN